MQLLVCTVGGRCMPQRELSALKIVELCGQLQIKLQLMLGLVKSTYPHAQLYIVHTTVFFATEFAWNEMQC